MTGCRPVPATHVRKPRLLRTERLLDGTGAAPRPATLVLEDGIVVDIVEGRTEAAASSGVGLDVGDRTVMPGLIDTHAHLGGMLSGGFERSPDPFRAASDTVELLVTAERLVRSGVTTVRDCGFPHHAIFAVRQAIDAGAFLGPCLLLSGRPITASGGHAGPMSVEIDGVDAARRATRLEAKAGADWIKVMVTGGTASPGEEVADVQLTFDEVAAIVDEAHRRGRRVCAHASNLAGLQLALRAQVDSVEHGIVLDDEAIRAMVAAGTWLVPTLRSTKLEAEADASSGIPAFTRRKAAQIYPDHVSSFQAALSGGVRIAAGTDGETSYLGLGAGSLAAELSLMVELGSSPEAALAAATSSAAELLGLAGVVGTLQRGSKADLIVLAADPLTDVRAVADPDLIISRGEVVRDRRSPRSTLEAR